MRGEMTHLRNVIFFFFWSRNKHASVSCTNSFGICQEEKGEVNETIMSLFLKVCCPGCLKEKHSTIVAF